jgi:hypothetical protein
MMNNPLAGPVLAELKESTEKKDTEKVLIKNLKEEARQLHARRKAEAAARGEGEGGEGGAKGEGVMAKLQPSKVIDLEAIQFSKGSNTMTNKECLLPTGSTRVDKPGWEEVRDCFKAKIFMIIFLGIIAEL